MGDLSAVIMIFRLQLFEVIPGKCDDGGVAIKPSTYLPSIRSRLIIFELIEFPSYSPTQFL